MEIKTPLKTVSGIYMYTNKVNTKVYIGQARNLYQRHQQHLQNARLECSNEYNSLLHKAFRKYGLDNFAYEIIELCDIDVLNEKEQYWISYYNSVYPNGYNMTLGGSNATSQKLTISQVEQITELLKNTNLTNIEIGLQYQVSENMISAINTGYYWKRDIEYPIRKKPEKLIIEKVSKKPPLDILIKGVYETSFVAVGQKHGVSDKTVSKWCASYGIPHTIKELREYYKIHYLGISEQEIQAEKDLKKKHAEQSQSKVVIQCNLKTNEELQTFNSCLAAARYLIEQGLTTAKESSIAANIGRVINGQRKSAYKFYWKQL